MHLSSENGAIVVHGNARFPVNRGGLCVKGWTAAATLAHADRLREPLVRGANGQLGPASWDAALNRVADAFNRIQTRYGNDAVAVFGSGALTNEKAYLVGKFARVGLGTANIDYNGRFCMSSAAAAGVRAFGIDRGLPFPLDDIPKAAAILLVGGNPAETMPPLMQYFEAQQRAGGCLIVADPRRTPTASWAQLHLQLRPGTDAALGNGLLHILIRDRMIDESYIAARTEGFGEARRIAASYWPERVEQITGVPEATLVDAAHRLGSAATAMVLTSRGPEQQAQGVMNTLAYVNVALALGMCGRVGGGFGTLTGQGNGQGGREHGQKSDQLPGYRWIDDPAARRHMADVWNVPAESIPGRGKSAYELIEAFGREIHGLLVVGSNIAVSAPDAVRVEKQLSALDTLVVADFFLSETAQLADVVLPSAQWAEEDGTMTNLEGRVIRRRRAMAPPPGVRSDIEILCGLAAALGKRHGFAFGRRSRRVCRAARRDARRARRLLRHYLRAARRQRRRVLALSGRRSSRHAAVVRRRVRDDERPRAIPRDAARQHRRRTERGVPAPPHHRPRLDSLPVGQSDTAHRRTAGCVVRASRRDAPGRRTTRGHQRRRCRHRRDAARIDELPREDHDAIRRRRHLRAVPLGRHAVRQPPDQPCSRSDQPDA